MRWALGVQYNGTGYCGFQTQTSGVATVQQALEAAIQFVANHPVRVNCAGRTDAGVHAIEQVVHFESDAKRSVRAWMLGLNTKLPQDISILWAQPVADDFHARFSATARRYRYQIKNTTTRHALSAKRAAWVFEPLEVTQMQLAATHLMGEHDFTAFRGPHCQAHSPVRTIQALTVTRVHDEIIIEIEANGFLHNMVRNIVGLLVEIGKGKYAPDYVKTVLEKRAAQKAAPTAPAWGLYFTCARYPAAVLPRLSHTSSEPLLQGLCSNDC